MHRRIFTYLNVFSRPTKAQRVKHVYHMFIYYLRASLAVVGTSSWLDSKEY